MPGAFVKGHWRTERQWKNTDGHFKCNLRCIVDYPNLWGYLRDLYQQPGVAETLNMDHIKKHYYLSHESINPTRIVPKGPNLDFTGPQGRERLSG